MERHKTIQDTERRAGRQALHGKDFEIGDLGQFGEKMVK